MYSERIEVGDSVTACFDGADWFFSGTVIQMPSQLGECWILRVGEPPTIYYVEHFTYMILAAKATNESK